LFVPRWWGPAVAELEAASRLLLEEDIMIKERAPPRWREAHNYLVALPSVFLKIWKERREILRNEVFCLFKLL
jgi:hypothetical protein